MRSRLVVFAMLAAIGGATLPVHGWAVVEIADSDPAGGATLPALPGEVEIWTAEPIDAAFGQIIVVAPNGARIDSGILEIDADDPTRIATTIASGGRAGHYTVHVLSGEPNTARERSASTTFDLESDSGCEDDDAGGCADALPQVEPGEELVLPGGGVIAVTLSTDRVGPVNIEVRLAGADGETMEEGRVWVRAAHLEMDHGEFPHAAVLNDDGIFIASYIGMGMEGAWRLAVDVILAEGTAPITVAVPVEMTLPG